MITLGCNGRVFDEPRLIFTVHDGDGDGPKNPRAATIIKELLGLPPATKQPAGFVPPRIEMVPSAEEVRARLEGGISPNAAVAVFDHDGSGFFSMTHAGKRSSGGRDQAYIPDWACGAFWGVQVHSRMPENGRRPTSCAELLRAIFGWRFRSQLNAGRRPWGPARKGAPPLEQVDLPEGTHEVLQRLNQGPDLAGSIVAAGHAMELPTGSRISWIRVPGEPGRIEENKLRRVTDALRAFEVAATRLIRTRREEIGRSLLAGVDLRDPLLRDLYLDPPTDCFSVDRPDLHWCGGDALAASEVDEMPGGMPETCHVDHAYGTNQDRWQWFCDWLTSRGPVLFAVSHRWSKVYLTETAWLVEHMRGQGYAAHMVSTEDLSGLEVGPDGVRFEGVKIGTVWRQFPIFETEGLLVELVAAAWRDVVRLVPEFGPWGNKALYAVFWKNLGFFAEALEADTLALLKEVLAESVLIQPGGDSFPCTIRSGGESIGVRDLPALYNLPPEWRNRVVMKVVGANDQSARMYGVLMGKDMREEMWREWINARLRLNQPWIVQGRFTTAVARAAVLHTARGAAEAFDCRLLLRPWVVDGNIVSIHCSAVPRETERLHGMVDMAVIPFALEPHA